MATSDPQQITNGSIELRLPAALLEKLINQRALAVSDLRCLNNHSKAELKRMLLNSL